MNLTNFKKIDHAIKTTNVFFLAALVVMATAFVISFFHLSYKINQAYSKALVIDTRGAVFETHPILAQEMRVYEFENHVKTFIGLWYGFDENNYEANVQKALSLIGNKGKELLNEYNDLGMLSELIQKNLRYDVLINDLQIDMTTIPVSGSVVFTQTGYRAKGKISRRVFVDFSLYEVARSRENVHGVKIEDWKVTYKPIDRENEIN